MMKFVKRLLIAAWGNPIILPPFLPHRAPPAFIPADWLKPAPPEDIPMVCCYLGRDIEELSRPELLAAIRRLGRELRQLNDSMLMRRPPY